MSRVQNNKVLFQNVLMVRIDGVSMTNCSAAEQAVIENICYRLYGINRYLTEKEAEDLKKKYSEPFGKMLSSKDMNKVIPYNEFGFFLNGTSYVKLGGGEHAIFAATFLDNEASSQYSPVVKKYIPFRAVFTIAARVQGEDKVKEMSDKTKELISKIRKQDREDHPELQKKVISQVVQREEKPKDSKVKPKEEKSKDSKSKPDFKPKYKSPKKDNK